MASGRFADDRSVIDESVPKDLKSNHYLARASVKAVIGGLFHLNPAFQNFVLTLMPTVRG